MKIGMLGYIFYESDNRVRRYAEALAGRGDQVDVIALRGRSSARHEILNGVDIFRIQNRVVNEKTKISYLYRLLAFFVNSTIFLARRHFKNHYDLIHVHSVPDFEVFATTLQKITGTRVVLDIHDIVPEFYASKFNVDVDSLVYKALVLIEKASICFSDHVIISNHIWEKTITSRSVAQQKCSTFINYPDTSVFHTNSRGRNDKKFLLVYPGSLNWHQGVDVAIKAFYLIKDKIPEAEFHIYGEGPYKDSLKDLIARLGLSSRVFLNAALPTGEIAKIMAHADLGIVPKRANSFGNEAFSTKIMEFMAVGVPVIVSNTKIDKYYFNESLVRFFASEDERDLADSILLLRNDAQMRRRLSENAQAFIMENNWEVKKKDYLDLVDALAGKTK